MKLLLDTHVLVWSVSNSARLRPETRAVLAAPRDQIFVSAASAWEIAIKQALGRLSFPLDRFDEVLDRLDAQPVPISMAHAIEAGSLPRHHDNPFDRLLIAQARIEAMMLVSVDATFQGYEVQLLGRD